MPESADIVVVGAGAAGLMAAIWAGRTARRAGAAPRIVALDGARTLGAKILVAGGGRCNVTHDVVRESDFAGAPRSSIRQVLARFDERETVRFFAALGVELKREETGKLFPVTDSARTVLTALLSAAREAGVEIAHPCRVDSVARRPDGFEVAGRFGALFARRLILATGGMSLPKTGSDGHGYALARALGHTITPRVFPALVPLLLVPGHPLTVLSGLTFEARLEVRSGTGKKLTEFTGSTLLTHFGLSGPAVLDISRYYLDARASDPQTMLRLSAAPGGTEADVDRCLLAPGRVGAARGLRERFGLPDRLATALCELAGVSPGGPGHALTREERRRLVGTVAALELPVVGDRGFAHAEVTAGGVPLAELRLGTLESRAAPGLHLCGEICDVDGRIGGYNFQWAWASGFVAGTAAANAPRAGTP
ncbi:MAG TPA: aminoacetone oxidase family FAD-binding enzyme [Phycisphaerales bacterium]|nr:aminoacetone oxidase family FAD-binding enzyme [Phycisphaerales bacterium]